MTIRNPLLDAALTYAAKGWPVIPLHSPDPARVCTCAKGPDCASPAKHPRVRDWRTQASTDLDQIAEWWAMWPAANVGIVCGHGLVVLDVDDAGWRPLAKFIREHGKLPETARVQTGSGVGAHYYFSAPIGAQSFDLAPGLEVRAAGRYVVAPPSVHASGGVYEWIAP
jgi:hypothetical protein